MRHKMIAYECSHTSQQGVTIVELVIVMGLMSALLVMIASLFTMSADMQQRTNGASATSSNGQFIMSRLNYDIARAAAITTPSSLGTTSSTLALTIGGSTSTYGVSGNDLQLTDSVGTDNLNTDGVVVSGLTFQEIRNGSGAPTIQYSFTLTSTAAVRGSNSQTFTSSAGLL